MHRHWHRSLMILKIHSFFKQCFFDFMKTRYFSWCQQGLAWKGFLKNTLFSFQWKFCKYCFENNQSFFSILSFGLKRKGLCRRFTDNLSPQIRRDWRYTLNFSRIYDSQKGKTNQLQCCIARVHILKLAIDLFLLCL